MRKPWMLALAGVAALAGCGDEVVNVTYDRPDATSWTAPRVRWTVPPGGAAVVTDSLSDTVSVLDLEAGRVMLTVPIGITPLAVNSPHHQGLDPARRVFYTPLAFPAPAIAPGPHAAHGSSVAPGVLIKRSLDDFRLLGRVDVEANPGEMLLSRDGRRAFVSHYDLVRALRVGNRDAQVSNLVVVDTETMRSVASLPLCIAAHGMALAPDGRALYVACAGDDAIGVVDLSVPDRFPVTLVPIGTALANGSPTNEPYSIAASPDGLYAYLGCLRTQTIYAYDVAARRFDETRTIRRMGGQPLFPEFSPDGGTMIVPLQNRDGIVTVRLSSPPIILDQVGVPRESCILPHQIARGPDGAMYLVCEGVHTNTRTEPGTVLRLDPETLEVRAVFRVGAYPDSIGFVGGRRDGGV